MSDLNDMKQSLPTWLTAQFPEHLPHSVISYRDDRFHVSHDGSEFDSFREAYDYTKAQTGYQLIIDDSVDGHGGELIAGFYFSEIAPGERSGSLMGAATTEEQVELIGKTYRHWLEIASAYESNADDFYTAYYFLDQHPAFWVKQTPEKSFYWITGKSQGKMAQTVYRDEKTGATKIMLETGGHVLDSFMYCYGDTRLTAAADTYEEAIVALAKKVHEVFNIDGTERNPGNR